jgi:hypothetical protein
MATAHKLLLVRLSDNSSSNSDAGRGADPLWVRGYISRISPSVYVMPVGWERDLGT